MDQHKQAFTLIELLVVVLIIGILAAVAVPQYQKAVMKSRYATLKNLVHTIAEAQEVYYLANGQYADDFAKLDVSMPEGYTTNSEFTYPTYTYDWGGCFMLTGGDKDERIECRNALISMGYAVWPPHTVVNSGLRRCYVRGSRTIADYPIQNKICQEETGLERRSGLSARDSDSPYVSWNYQD